MKHLFTAACLALSLGFCTNAMAKDVDAIDIFAGNNITGVATADIVSLVNNKMITDNMSKAGADMKQMDSAFAELKALGVDYKKDLKLVTIAVAADNSVCGIVDAKKSLKSAWDALTADASNTVSTYKNFTVVKDEDTQAALLSDTRILACDIHSNINAVLDNVAKPKSLKSADKAVYDAFSKTSAKADIRIGARMTDNLRAEAAGLKISAKDGSRISLSDADAVSLSLDFKSGIAVDADVLAKNEKMASTAAGAISDNVMPLLSDPALNELGIGFVKDAVKISSAKKDVKASVRLTDDQVESLVALLLILTSGGQQ